MIDRFRVYSLDNGSLIVICPKCDFHIVLKRAWIEEAKNNTVLGVIHEIDASPSCKD